MPMQGPSSKTTNKPERSRQEKTTGRPLFKLITTFLTLITLLRSFQWHNKNPNNSNSQYTNLQWIQCFREVGCWNLTRTESFGSSHTVNRGLLNDLFFYYSDFSKNQISRTWQKLLSSVSAGCLLLIFLLPFPLFGSFSFESLPSWFLELLIFRGF